MAAWWIDRVLPGVLVWLPTFVVGQWMQTGRLRRHLEQVTADQTRELKAEAEHG